MFVEMGPLVGSIGGASRLFPDPYREFWRDGLFCSRFGAGFSCFASSEYCARLMWDLPVLRVLHQVPGLAGPFPDLRVAGIAPG